MKSIVCTFVLISFLSIASGQVNLQNQIQKFTNEAVDNKLIIGATVAVSKGDSTWLASAGNIKSDTHYFIASVTKIYVTAIVLKLEQEGKLSLNDPIKNYLDKSILNNLLVFEGTDFSDQITIKHLLSHTSGIPDYFEDKGDHGKSLLEELTGGKDQTWTYEQSISLSKKMKPRFSPGDKDYAHYSDTNFQLLDLILEKITGKKIDALMTDLLFQPLGLKETWLYTDPLDKRPIDLNYKKEPLVIPNAMTCFKGDGGIVSTAHETMIFLKAFMNGFFFPKQKLQEMAIWKKVMFPLEYGIGIMRFKLPKSMTGGKEYPELIGHSGLSGAFSYYCPEKELYMTGTVNQIHKPGKSYQLMIKLMNLF
jgi:CubicO group peptidase (beta-lactamase class C family)